jgi:hypothetical protein
MNHEKLSVTLSRLLEVDATSGQLTLGRVFERMGDRGFGLLLMVLSLPSALPIPAPGYSTPFGVLLFMLALQMLAGRASPWLPNWAANRRLDGAFVRRMLAVSSGFFERVEKLIRPRLRWIGSRGGRIWLGSLIAVMAFLMILPIPLTNTFPAFVIFIIAIGLTEEDGVFTIFGTILCAVAVFLYGFVVWFFIQHGPEGIERIKDFIKGLLGSGGA